MFIKPIIQPVLLYCTHLWTFTTWLLSFLLKIVNATMNLFRWCGSKGLFLHYARNTPNAVISSHMTSRIRYQSAVFVAATRSQFQQGESNQRSKNRWQWWFVECNNWFSVVIRSWSFPKIVVFLFLWGWSRHHSCFKIQLLNKRASFKNKCFAMVYGCSPNSLRISNLLSIWRWCSNWKAR